MFDFIGNVLDTSDFPARWHCGSWSTAHGLTHIVSDFAIFGAYAAIPLALAFFVLRRRDVPFLPIFWLFVAFIFSAALDTLSRRSSFGTPGIGFRRWSKCVPRSSRG